MNNTNYDGPNYAIPSSLLLLPLRFKYSPQHPVLTLNLYSSLNLYILFREETGGQKF